MNFHHTKKTAQPSTPESLEQLQAELLMLYGKSYDIGEGKRYPSLTRQGLKRLLKDICHVQQHLMSLRHIYLVDLDGQTVLSIGQRKERASSKPGGTYASH